MGMPRTLTRSLRHLIQSWCLITWHWQFYISRRQEEYIYICGTGDLLSPSPLVLILWPFRESVNESVVNYSRIKYCHGLQQWRCTCVYCHLVVWCRNWSLPDKIVQYKILHYSHTRPATLISTYFNNVRQNTYSCERAKLIKNEDK